MMILGGAGCHSHLDVVQRNKVVPLEDLDAAGIIGARDEVLVVREGDAADRRALVDLGREEIGAWASG